MPRPIDERQESINAELKATERRINSALKDMSSAVGLDYAPIPTEAQNKPDLLWLQKAQHVANALDALTAAKSAAAPSAPETLPAERPPKRGL